MQPTASEASPPTDPSSAVACYGGQARFSPGMAVLPKAISIAFSQVALAFAEGLGKKEIVVEKEKIRIDIEKAKCGKIPIYGLKC